MRRRGITLPGAITVLCLASGVMAGTFYWDGPADKDWTALDNGGLSWWRVNSMSGAFSPTLPGDDDVCYITKTTHVKTTVDLGNPGHYAVIHVGNGGSWGWYENAGNNPVVVEAGGTADFGNSSGSYSWFGSITLNGDLRLYKPEHYRDSWLQQTCKVSGPGKLICLNRGDLFIENYKNDYAGGTEIHGYESFYDGVNFGNDNPAASGGADGVFGTGPVDIFPHGLVEYNNSSHFTNDITSFYGCVGTNRIRGVGNRRWVLKGSNVVWRPGPRDNSGVGVREVADMTELGAAPDDGGGYPTLLIGIMPGGTNDMLSFVDNGSGAYADFKPDGNLMLVLTNVATDAGHSDWKTQLDTKYTVADLVGSAAQHTVTGRFANVHEPVAGMSYERIRFGGQFDWAYITYEGESGSGALSGGNDVLLWSVTPRPPEATLLRIQ